jgi:hypothetical protein
MVAFAAIWVSVVIVASFAERRRLTPFRIGMSGKPVAGCPFTGDPPLAGF